MNILYCIVITTVGQSNKGSCPEDFYLAEEDGDICYFVSATSETYNWHDAKSTCENKGASLAELKTDDEFYAVEIVLLTYGFKVWIGGNDLVADNSFKWISGGSIPNPSNKWAEGEPNNYRGDQDCLAIQKESDKYLYDDDYCSKRQPILCQFVLN